MCAIRHIASNMSNCTHIWFQLKKYVCNLSTLVRSGCAKHLIPNWQPIYELEMDGVSCPLL